MLFLKKNYFCMIGVLFVCLGNICRSPLAEGIFKRKVEEAGLNEFIAIDSAGTSGWHINEPPDRRSADIARKNGIRLDHYGQQISPKDFDQFDYIIAMDGDNYDDIIRMRDSHGNGKAEVLIMREFDDQQSGSDVPDPYYGGPNGFQLVYDLLDESLSNFLNKIIEDHELK
jgi:protein-tyrosine phosphatase